MSHARTNFSNDFGQKQTTTILASDLRTVRVGFVNTRVSLPLLLLLLLFLARMIIFNFNRHAKISLFHLRKKKMNDMCALGWRACAVFGI